MFLFKFEFLLNEQQKHILENNVVVSHDVTEKMLVRIS